MKIERRAVKASINSEQEVSTSLVVDKYQEAINHIRCAIDCLGNNAKEDVLARESIANLSVVLFELKD